MHFQREAYSQYIFYNWVITETLRNVYCISSKLFLHGLIDLLDILDYSKLHKQSGLN